MLDFYSSPHAKNDAPGMQPLRAEVRGRYCPQPVHVRGAAAGTVRLGPDPPTLAAARRAPGTGENVALRASAAAGCRIGGVSRRRLDGFAAHEAAGCEPGSR